MKKIVTVVIALFTLSMPFSPVSAAGSGAPVSFEDRTLDIKAHVNGPSVYLPVRACCEALGYEVVWSDLDGVQSAVISKNGDQTILDLTHQEVSKNGHTFGAGVYYGTGITLDAGRMYLDSGLFSSVFPAGTVYDAKLNQITLQRRWENNITIVTEKLTSSKEHLKTTIQYPQLSGLADTRIQKSINEILKESAQAALNEGLKNADDMTQAIRDGYTGAVGMCETYYDFMVQYNQNGLFSVVLTNYQYAGGAHGSTIQSSFTFELSTGKNLQLSDLMKSDADYTGFMNEIIRKEIDRRAATGDLFEFEFSRFKDIGANPEFYLSNGAVVFYFQEYAYFPYAAGIQEFGVTYLDLNTMLKNDYRFLYGEYVERDGNHF